MVGAVVALVLVAAVDAGAGDGGVSDGGDASGDAALTPTLSRKRERGQDAGDASDRIDASSDLPSDLPLPLAGEGRGEGRPKVPTVPLRGRVLEKGTRRPLGAVAIAVDGAWVGETGADGAFQIEVAPGAHHLQLQMSGHEPIDRRVEAGAGAPEEIYRLPPRLTAERYETTVKAARPELPRIGVSAAEARRIPGASGDPIRVLGSLPGVAQVIWPAAFYVVRGANPGNTGFFLDGVRVPALFHLALGPSVVHPYLVAGVDFYPGAYPAAFGGAVSGIMTARTIAPPTDRVHVSADVTLYDAGGIATAPWDGGRGTVAVAARYSYTGALFSLLSSDTVLRYGDYQLRADHPLAGGQATLFAFGSVDDLGWLSLDSEKEYASLQFHRVDFRWRRGLAGGGLLAGVTLGMDWTRSTLFDRPIRMRALNVAPRVVYERSLGAAVGVEVGADALAQYFDSAVPDFQRRGSDLSRSRPAFSQGAFATLSFRAGRRLTISPGIRGELFAEQGVVRVVPEPRLAAALQLTPAIALLVNGGRFAQMPTLPVSVAGFEAFGLADLGLQTALGGSVGVETRLPRAFTVGVTGYAQRLRVTDVRDIDLLTLDPAAPDFLVSRRGRAAGVELLVRRADHGRVFGWLAYTLSWSQREDDGGVFGRSDWDQRHILNLVAGWRPAGAWTVGARFHYNTGRFAPVIDGGGLHRQLPAFYDLDLRAERRFIFDRFILDAYADFANVTLTRQVIELVALDPDTMSGLGERAFSIVLPTIGVHAEF